MTLILSFLVASAVSLFLTLLIVAGLSRHKKAAMSTQVLIGATGFLQSEVDPEGAVIINGELWRARAQNGSPLKARHRVRVVGVQAYFLLVIPESEARA